MRNRVVIRQWGIVRELRRGSRTLGQLAEALRCSERTIRRDLAALQEAYVPIVQEDRDGAFAPRYGLMKQAPCPTCGRQAAA
jgi:predicted DNA-binding transcriptional regulator YafY